MRDAIIALFADTFGIAPAQVLPMAADGSQRLYYRLTGAPRGPLVGAFGPDREENAAFLSYSRSFRGIGLPVPEIYAADEARNVWLEEDLGDTTLFQALSARRARDGGGFPPALVPVYERVVELLPRFQIEGGRVIDFGVAYPRSAFDAQSMQWDLNYFKYHFLKLAHLPFNEQRLENDFQRLTAHLLTAESDHFLYRDCQSRNVMLRGADPWFIDYQGGRRGAPQYDIASLLYDAKADLSEPVRTHLLERYVEALSHHAPEAARRFHDTYASFVVIRIMQAMGAYGYRGFFERKVRFLESVPLAARNIARLLEVGLPIALPELEGVFGRIVEGWADRVRPADAAPGLTVQVRSFSYRNGLPPDETGHGGGYVFDCRAVPNPGRDPVYATQTGLDRPVIAYLEAAPETLAFWTHVAPLIDAHVDEFKRRRFSDLSVAFGCTGGQHRSVYFAERLTRHLRERHPDVAVRLEHGERGRWPASAPDTPGAETPGAESASAPSRGGAWKR